MKRANELNIPIFESESELIEWRIYIYQPSPTKF